MLTGLFERCMKRRGVKESDPFDWEKPIETIQPPLSVNVIANNTTPVISRPVTCTSYGAEINNQLVTSTIDNEDKEPPENRKSSPEVSALNFNIYHF